MSNEITAYFKGRAGVAESVYQYDYGMVLVIDGLDFVNNFDCYFSTSGDDEAIPAIGSDNRVAIPNSCLTRPGDVTLHIPTHTGENDSEVEHVVTFRVIGRARPSDDGTAEEQSAVSKAIALLNHTNASVIETIDAYLDENAAEPIQAWLDEHPEATTTVQDGAITIPKLANDVKSLFAIVHDTVADMVADADLVDGMVVTTLGYYNQDDGGQGLYSIRNANVNEVANGGSTHLLNNGLIAELIPDNKNILNFKQWGAKADGETDCSPIYNNCIDYIKTVFPVSYIQGDRGKGGAIIYIPSGTYYFASTCEARHYVSIVGENRHTTVITSSADKVFYSNVDNYTSGTEIVGRQWNFNLKNLTFANCATVLNQVQSINTVIDNCTFVSCSDIAIVLYLTVNVKITNCIFYSCKEGILFNSTGSGPSTTVLISNCWFAHCTVNGVRAEFSTNGIEPLTIENTIFEYNNRAIYAYGSETYPTVLNIDKCYFEGNSNAGNISNCSLNADSNIFFDSTDAGISVYPADYTSISFENKHEKGFTLSRNTVGNLKCKLYNGRIFDTYEKKVTIPGTKGLGFSSFIPIGIHTVIVVYKSDTGYYMGAISVTVNANLSTSATKLNDIAGNLSIALNNSRLDITDANATSYSLSVYY